MQKDRDVDRGGAANDAMDRSDEVAASAAPQGDGAPDEGAEPERGGSAATGTETGADYRRMHDDVRDKYLRLAAEYDNFRKRTAKERAEAGARGQAELVKSLLDPLDDLARFAHVDPGTVDAATVVEGAALVERKLNKALANAGLEMINPLDQPFNPALHEAVATEPALSREDDHMVGRVFQPGYLFNGQLLRPARVVVKQWNG